LTVEGYGSIPDFALVAPGALFVQPIVTPPVTGMPPRLPPQVAFAVAYLAAETINRYFRSVDRDRANQAQLTIDLFPQLQNLSGADPHHQVDKDDLPVEVDVQRRPRETCAALAQSLGPATAALRTALMPNRDIKFIGSNATIAAAVYCIDGKIGTAISASGNRSNSGLGALAVADFSVRRVSDALGSGSKNEFHAETNVLSEVIRRAPVSRTSVGAIVMWVDNPKGLICPYCIESFRSFERFAPLVSLSVFARLNQWQNGQVHNRDLSNVEYIGDN
jgi:hypothetical protein